ncbi:MAG: nucleotide exchange factor GrpE [Solobacterium sp.]|nr:nucleotide exchange factor GrpE [Solobacterium sp.]
MSTAMKAVQTGTEELVKEGEALRKDNNRLFQDFCEELDDFRKEQAEEFDHLKSLITAKSSPRRNTENDRDLIQLIHLYRAEVTDLEAILRSDEAWNTQIRLLEEKMRHEEASLGLFAFGKEGEAANPDMHQITEIIPCDDPKKDKTIARVFEEGFMIRGKIAQKAIAAVFKYGGTSDETRNHYRN